MATSPVNGDLDDMLTLLQVRGFVYAKLRMAYLLQTNNIELDKMDLSVFNPELAAETKAMLADKLQFETLVPKLITAALRKCELPGDAVRPECRPKRGSSVNGTGTYLLAFNGKKIPIDHTGLQVVRGVQHLYALLNEDLLKPKFEPADPVTKLVAYRVGNNTQDRCIEITWKHVDFLTKYIRP